MRESSARCGCYVGLGNLPRTHGETTVCEDCFTLLVEQDSVATRLERYLGALRERIRRLFAR